MLRGNLSTRPFYNERLAMLAVAGLGVLALLLTVFNATRIYGLTAERTAARARLAAADAETAAVRAQALGLQGNLDRPTLNGLAAASREANQIIDRRTFSWTGLFALLEKTMPIDIRLTGIAPRPDRDTFRVGMSIVARDLDDVDVFIEALRETGAFYDVAPTEQRLQEDGTYTALIEASYLAAPATAATEASVEGAAR